MPQNCFYHKIAAYVISWISVSFFFPIPIFLRKICWQGKIFLHFTASRLGEHVTCRRSHPRKNSHWSTEFLKFNPTPLLKWISFTRISLRQVFKKKSIYVLNMDSFTYTYIKYIHTYFSLTWTSEIIQFVLK